MLPPPLRAAKRIVLKIGSALLVGADGAVRRNWLNALADDIADLRERGADVLVVSSGSIAVGRRHLKLPKRPLRLEEKQAAAATGQIRLAHAWQEALARHDLTVAQILLTPSDTEERRRHLNARNTLLQLWKLGVVPVVNENDTVATEEIRYGDNDRLAARVAAMASADVLILLSDIDGLYSSDPRRNAAARHIPLVKRITSEIEAIAGPAPEGVSSGGMRTKVAAAKIALAGGCQMAVALGTGMNPVRRILEGARCTWFQPTLKPMAARKQWIAGTLNPAGKVVVDAGAVAALARGKSLLPAGVVAVCGAFQRGDAVVLRDGSGRRLGVGLVTYASDEADRIKGLKSSDIPAALGHEGRTELIHRDDLVLEGDSGE